MHCQTRRAPPTPNAAALQARRVPRHHFCVRAKTNPKGTQDQVLYQRKQALWRAGEQRLLMTSSRRAIGKSCGEDMSLWTSGCVLRTHLVRTCPRDMHWRVTDERQLLVLLGLFHEVCWAVFCLHRASDVAPQLAQRPRTRVGKGTPQPCGPR